MWIALKLLLEQKNLLQVLRTRGSTYQSKYFIDYFMQGNFKYPRIMKIQQVHQKLQTKQFQLFLTICMVQTPNLVILWTSISRVLLILRNQSQQK